MRHFYPTILILFLLSLTLTACRPTTVSSPATATVETSPLPIITPSNLPTQPAVGDSEETTPTPPEPSYTDISYTEANPLTDPAKIQHILAQLQQYQLDWFSHVGWLHYTLITADASDFTRIEHFWMYVSDKNLGCREQFVYFESEGEILPYKIRLENGSAARIEPLRGNLNPDFIYEAAPVCTLKSDWIITFIEGEDDSDFFLRDEATHFRTVINQDEPGLEKHYRAWTEELDGRQTFIMEYEYNYTDPSTAGMLYDPHAGTFNLPAQRLLRITFDLENGLLVRDRGVFYDQNGQELNISLSGTNIGRQIIYEFCEALPQPVAQAYDQSAEKLRTFLQENQP